MVKKVDKVTKVMLIILYICLVILTIETIIACIFHRSIDMPESDYDTYDKIHAYKVLYSEYDKGVNSWQMDKKFYRDTVTDLAKLGPYLYFEKDIKSASGLSIALIPSIIVDEELDDAEIYCWVFTHEVMHIKRFSANETYVCFETFKFLYESENDYLHNAGVRYGTRQLNGYYHGEYDCSGYIINYLKKEIL